MLCYKGEAEYFELDHLADEQLESFTINPKNSSDNRYMDTWTLTLLVGVPLSQSITCLVTACVCMHKPKYCPHVTLYMLFVLYIFIPKRLATNIFVHCNSTPETIPFLLCPGLLTLTSSFIHLTCLP